MKVFICDDDEVMLSIVQTYLSFKGFDVRISVDSLTVIEQIEAFSPDVVVLDIQMPFYSGEEIYKKLKSNASTAKYPIIFWSSYPNEGEVAALVKGHDFISKPFVLDKLETVLKKWNPSPA